MEYHQPVLSTADDQFLRSVEAEVQDFKKTDDSFASVTEEVNKTYLYPTERFFGHLEDTQIFAITVGHGALENTPISAGTDTTIRVWEPAVSRHPEKTWTGHHLARISCLASSSPSGGCVFSGSWDNSIGMWNSKTGNCVGTLSGHYAEVTALLWADDRLFSSSNDQQVIVWDVRTKQQTANYRSPSAGGVYSVASCGEPDPNLALIGCCDGSVNLIDMRCAGADKLVRTYEGHGTGVSAVGRLGMFVVSADRSGRLLTHDFGSGVLIQELPGVHTNRVTAMESCPDTGHIFTASVDGSVREWSNETGNLAPGRALTSCDLMMNCLAVGKNDKDERVVYFGGDDCTLRRWTPDGAQLQAPGSRIKKQEVQELPKCLKELHESGYMSGAFGEGWEDIMSNYKPSVEEVAAAAAEDAAEEAKQRMLKEIEAAEAEENAEEAAAEAAQLQAPAAAEPLMQVLMEENAEAATAEMTYDASTQRKIDALRGREKSHGLNEAQRGILQGLLESGTPIE